VGRSESILPFSGLGCACHDVRTSEEAAKLIRSLAQQGTALILVEDIFAGELEELFVEFSGRSIPVLSTFAGLGGPVEMPDRLRSVLRLAVGVDIAPPSEQSPAEQPPSGMDER